MKKYSVSVSKKVWCSSSGHYSGRAIVRDGIRRSIRLVDLSDFRVMHKNNILTYQGYPKYIMCDIAQAYKSAWDAGDITVSEHDQFGHERTVNLRYHDPHRLQRIINFNYKQWCED